MRQRGLSNQLTSGLPPTSTGLQGIIHSDVQILKRMFKRGSLLQFLNFCLLLLTFGLVLSPLFAVDVTKQNGSINHSVPLEHIVIDNRRNFTGRFIAFTDASNDELLQARNRLRPFCDVTVEKSCFTPSYESGETANEWLNDKSQVIGYVDSSGNAYAFPLQILAYHVVVNDILADEPILVTYCDTCGSSGVFSRKLDNEILTFGNISAFYQNVGTVYDVNSGSLWLINAGRAIVGSHTDTVLQVKNSVTTTWPIWYSEHPETQVLSRIEAYVDYTQPTFVDQSTLVSLNKFTFPVSDSVLQDQRLPLEEKVLLLRATSNEISPVAYAVDILTEGITNIEFDGLNYIILKDKNNTVAVYESLTDDHITVDIVYDSTLESWIDRSSHSELNMSGVFISGTLEGKQLIAPQHTVMFWYAALVSYPDVVLCC